MTPHWYNALGEEVDLDNIDREYALNILMHYSNHNARCGWIAKDFLDDPLTQKLRDIILNGREPVFADRIRAFRYNVLCKMRGLPYRAKV